MASDMDSKEEKSSQENVDFLSQLLASRLNGTLTNIGKYAMNWLVGNKSDDIYWNFDVSNTKQKYIAFTMDDSPGIGLQGTIEILDFLKSLNIQITFFIISSMVRDPTTKEINPNAAKVIRRMLADGHELGNHAVYDKKLMNLEENEYYENIKECEDTICLFDKTFQNKKVKWYRPPWGAMTKLHYDVVHKLGYKVAMANKFGRDINNCQNFNFLVDFYTNDIKNGDIIVMHTPDEHNKTQKRYELLKPIKAIIQKLQRRDVILTTLSEVYART
eukprot:209024_1